MTKLNRGASRNKSRGFGVLGWLLAIPLAIVVLIFLVIGVYEGRKAYWDSKVREMCEKDGGVTVFESVSITDEEYKHLGGLKDGLPLPWADDAKKKNYPYFREIKEARLHDFNPEVVRRETLVKRRSDGSVLGKSVYYSRRGGDVPTGLFHDSSFGCPSQNGMSKKIFKIEGAPK
jgi:hypothetical protein